MTRRRTARMLVGLFPLGAVQSPHVYALLRALPNCEQCSGMGLRH
jgi:hypothetical protein